MFISLCQGKTGFTGQQSTPWMCDHDAERPWSGTRSFSDGQVSINNSVITVTLCAGKMRSKSRQGRRFINMIKQVFSSQCQRGIGIKLLIKLNDTQRSSYGDSHISSPVRHQLRKSMWPQQVDIGVKFQPVNICHDYNWLAGLLFVYSVCSLFVLEYPWWLLSKNISNEM